MRKCKLLTDQLWKIMVSEETLEIAAEWVDGHIIGTKLPRRERSVKFWSKYRDHELYADQGDYIVQLADGVFDVYPPEMFHKIFIDTDSIPF